MSVMKVLIETEEFLEWMKNKYVSKWEEYVEFIVNRVIEKDNTARKIAISFKTSSEIYKRKFLKELEETKILVQITKKDAGKENLFKIKKKVDLILNTFKLDFVLLNDFKKELLKKYGLTEDIFSEAANILTRDGEYLNFKWREIINNINSSMLQKKGFFERLKNKGLLSHFKSLKKKETLNIAGKKVTIKIYSRLDFIKININNKESTYKNTALDLLSKHLNELPEGEEKDLYSIYSEELKEKTNNEIILALVDYVYELCKFVIETNPQYILSDDFIINLNIMEVQRKEVMASCNSSLCTDDSIYIIFNFLPLLYGLATNYDFFQGKYLFTKISSGGPVTWMAHELAHAKDFHNLNFQEKIIAKIHEEMKLKKDITLNTINLFVFFLTIRNEAISQISEIFIASEKENEYARPAYFITNHFNSSFNIYEEGFNTLIEDTKNSIEVLRGGLIDGKFAGKYTFAEATVVSYNIARHCAFIIFLYFYFNSKQEKIFTYGNDTEKIREKLMNYSISIAGQDVKKIRQVRNDTIFNPDKFKSFLVKNEFHLLNKSEICKCLIEDVDFNVYLPDFNFATQFLTALKNMNFVRFFEYYEKACRYFDIPKEKTIFALKELKETQQFAEQLHREAVKNAGFEH